MQRGSKSSRDLRRRIYCLPDIPDRDIFTPENLLSTGLAWSSGTCVNLATVIILMKMRYPKPSRGLQIVMDSARTYGHRCCSQGSILANVSFYSGQNTFALFIVKYFLLLYPSCPLFYLSSLGIDAIVVGTTMKSSMPLRLVMIGGARMFGPPVLNVSLHYRIIAEAR